MKIIVLLFGLIALLVPVAQAQEVVVGGFPLGVGSSIGPEFWDPYVGEFEELARTLKDHPEARAVIVGRADGSRYASGNDAKNPGLSLGRAHALRNVLVGRFGVDSTQVFIQTNDVSVKGGQYRSVSIRIEMPAEPPPAELAVVPPVVVQEEPAETAPPVQMNETNNYFYDRMSLKLTAGGTSSPFGAMPMLAGAIVWSGRVALEAVMGHTFWNDTYQFQGAQLETWQRMVSAQIIYYPWRDKSIGIVGGWRRQEEIAQSYYEYVRLSEGPVLGVTWAPFKHLELSGLYNPSRQRVEGTDLSSGRAGQFLISVGVFTTLGGGR